MEEEEHEEDVDFIVPEKKQKQSKQEDDEEGEGTNSTFTFEKQVEIEKTIDNRKFDDDNNFNRRKYAHEDTSHSNWFKHHKHIFVLTSAGKPIYSRYGDEQNISPFIASLTALVSFIQDMKDNIRYVVAGDHKFVFVVKGPIILVSVARTFEPVSQLVQQLHYIHGQIISILTGRVEQMLVNRAQFDLRGLLGGADRFLDNLMSLMDHDFSFLLNSIHCLRFDGILRNSIATALQQAQSNDLLYGILMAKYQLVTLIRRKRYILQPYDLHLITNFINASSSFRSSESNWTPICLPKFNDQGFLHALVCFIAQDICLLLISTQTDAFEDLSKRKNTIVETLKQNNNLETLSKTVQKGSYSVSELQVPSLLHFIYKSNAVCQFTMPKFEPPYDDKKEKKRLFRLYQSVHARVHRFKKRTHKVYFQVSDKECIVGWITGGFELYAAFGPLETKPTCIKGCNQILRWIEVEENSLFILNSPIW